MHYQQYLRYLHMFAHIDMIAVVGGMPWPSLLTISPIYLLILYRVFHPYAVLFRVFYLSHALSRSLLFSPSLSIIFSLPLSLSNIHTMHYLTFDYKNLLYRTTVYVIHIADIDVQFIRFWLYAHHACTNIYIHIPCTQIYLVYIK